MHRDKYNDYGRQQTGFDSDTERSFYGHWKNPKYSLELQEAEHHYRLNNDPDYFDEMKIQGFNIEMEELRQTPNFEEENIRFYCLYTVLVVGFGKT
jgi:hypothetical protein